MWPLLFGGLVSLAGKIGSKEQEKNRVMLSEDSISARQGA